MSLQELFLSIGLRPVVHITQRNGQSHDESRDPVASYVVGGHGSHVDVTDLGHHTIEMDSLDKHPGEGPQEEEM